MRDDELEELRPDFGEIEDRAALEEQLEDEELEDPDGDPDERYGFGVCARGTCIEPCGPNGGCIAGSRRRRSRGF